MLSSTLKWNHLFTSLFTHPKNYLYYIVRDICSSVDPFMYISRIIWLLVVKVAIICILELLLKLPTEIDSAILLRTENSILIFIQKVSFISHAESAILMPRFQLLCSQSFMFMLLLSFMFMLREKFPYSDCYFHAQSVIFPHIKSVFVFISLKASFSCCVIFMLRVSFSCWECHFMLRVSFSRS